MVKDNEVIRLLNERYGYRTGLLTRMFFVFAELTGPILFHTEFGIPSVHGGQMYLQRVSVVSAHTPTAGH